MGSWEWIIILVIGLGLLVAELVSVRRSIAKARDAAPSPVGEGRGEGGHKD